MKNSKPEPLSPHRLAYIKVLNSKLALSRAKLAYIKCKVDLAEASGRIRSSTQLQEAEQLAEDRLAAAEGRIHGLQSCDNEHWDERRGKTDIAVNELSEAVQKMAARFS